MCVGAYVYMYVYTYVCLHVFFTMIAYSLECSPSLTVGSGQTLMPTNGQHEMTQLTLPTDYDDIAGLQTSDVINNQSAVAYETPQTTLQRQSNEMYDDIRDPLSTSKGAPENSTVYSEMVYTNPDTDNSDHEYQDADELSPEEVKHRPPLVSMCVCSCVCVCVCVCECVCVCV